MLSTLSSLSPRSPAKSTNAFIQKWDSAPASNPLGRTQRHGGQRDRDDAVLAEAVGILNRADARVKKGEGGVIIGLPKHSINAATRQAASTLFGERCQIVLVEDGWPQQQKHETPQRPERWLPWRKW